MSLLTAELAALAGREAVYTAPEKLGAAAIRYFAAAVGDPLATDPAYAAARPGEAPPTLICETNQYTALPPDEDGFAGHGWGIEIPGTRLVRGGNDYTFHAPATAATVLTVTWRIVSVEERTTGGGQDMLVVTSRADYTDQHGTALASNTETLIYVALEAR